MSKYPLRGVDTASGLSHRTARRLFRACALLALLAAMSSQGRAQQNGRGMTPPGLAPGSPVGSYSLSGFENVNLFNGNLNFNLPLLKIGGRGRVGASINLAVNSVKWDMSFMAANATATSGILPWRPRGMDEDDVHTFDFNIYSACVDVNVEGVPPSCELFIDTDPNGVGGMPPMQLPMVPQTSGYVFFPIARPDWVKWDFLAPGYGPGVVRGSRSEAWEQYLYPSPSDPRHSDPHNHKSQTLYRMKFVEPDGTEHELIDTYTGGKPTFHSYAPEDDVKRGRVFVSTDGSAMTFVASAEVTDNSGDPAGELFFPDGTRCHVAGGLIKSVRDPDGNYITYSYGSDPTHLESLGRVVEIRDTLGRRVTITYGDLTNVMYDEIKYNGVGSELGRSVKVWHSRLANALRPDQTLKTTGELFPGTSRIGNLPTRQYNPIVTSAVELPDHRQYRLRYNSYGAMALVELPTGAAIKYNYADPVVRLSGILHRVKERLVSPDGVNWEQSQDFTPEYSVGANDTTEGWGTVVRVDTHDLKDGGDRLVSRERHFFHGHPLLSVAPQLFYPGAFEGREYQVERLNTEGSEERVLGRTKMEWRQRETPSWWQSFTHSTFQLTPSNAPPRDPRVVTTTTSIEPYAGGANLVAKQTSVDPSDSSGNTVGFDQFNNRTDLWEYDFGANGQAGPLLRHTYTKYVQTLNVGGTEYDYACATAAACGQTLGPDGVIRFNGDPERVIHMRGLPEYAEVRVPAGGSNEAVVSRSVFRYDEPTYTGDDGYGTLPTDFPGWVAPLTLARGRLTTAKVWLDTLGGYQDEENAYLKTHTQYDRFGNAVKSWDARGNTSEVKFSPSYKYALPTEAVSADPDGTGPLTPLTATTVYDFGSGAVTDTFDANGQQTHAEYEADGLDRLKKLYRPDGGWTEYEYGDQPGSLYLRTRTLREAGTALMTQDGGPPPAEQTTAESLDKVLSGYQFFDGLGRAVRSTSRTGGSSWAATATAYDGVGRVVKVSNPYETSDYEGAVPQDALWTVTEYDELGRAWKVTTPDGAKAVTHFDGLRTLVTDQAGVQRISKSDALGRLTEVWEVRSSDAATGTEAVSFPHYADVPDVAFGYKTSYAYDVLGNLRKVEQGAQRRYFAYDSLSRLLRAKNPEQDAPSALQLPAGFVSPLSDNNNGWSLKYEYDEAGNLKKRTDARGVSTDYTYDALSRVTFWDYSDSTPDVTYEYGNDPTFNTKGRLTSVSSSISTYSYTAFDVMGRVTASSQTTAGQQPYRMGYAYDLAGNLTSETYPSGRVVVSEYDSAGRLAGVKNQGGTYYAGGDPSVTNNPNVIQYTAQGAVAAIRLGNGLWEHTLYNSRLQPLEVGLGTSRTDSSKLKLEYGYGLSVSGTVDPAKNNGNVRSQRISVPAEGSTPAQTFTQSYTYDPLNRLESAAEVKGAAETWRQTYTYDRYGNRRLDEQLTTKLNSAGATVHAVDSSNRAMINPALSASSNRISEAGYSFDAAGDLLCDPQHPCGPAPSFTPYFDYDAEGRIAKAAGGAQAGGSGYDYDGDGRRVKKVSASEVTVFVYDAAGALVAEYGGAQPQAGGVSYLTQDTLGSTRVVTGQSGEVKSRHDYQPFGDEIDGLKAPNTGREGFTSYNYGSVRQKFTGYERDDETGLDFSQARYYGNLSGRFTSPDPSLTSADPSSPQSWNRYAYCENNPLNCVDPTGLDGVWGYKTQADGTTQFVHADSEADLDEYNKILYTPFCREFGCTPYQKWTRGDFVFLAGEGRRVARLEDNGTMTTFSMEGIGSDQQWDEMRSAWAAGKLADWHVKALNYAYDNRGGGLATLERNNPNEPLLHFLPMMLGMVAAERQLGTGLASAVSTTAEEEFVIGRLPKPLSFVGTPGYKVYFNEGAYDESANLQAVDDWVAARGTFRLTDRMTDVNMYNRGMRTQFGKEVMRPLAGWYVQSGMRLMPPPRRVWK
jgi:RHS repeat-associated protein